MNKETLNTLRATLEKEHETLVSELKLIAKPDPDMPGDWDAKFPAMDQSESGHAKTEVLADEIEEYEVQLEAEHTLETRLLRVNQALDRIKNGTYGKCGKCGKDIPLERLQANPAADNCITHSV